MPTALFDSFTPEITTPEAYEHVDVKPIQNRINGDVMGVRWLREDGTWKIIRIEDIAYLEEILDDRMSFAAYPPAALKYLNDSNRILTWEKAVNMIMGQIVLLTKEPDPVPAEGGYPLTYRPFVYPFYSGQYVKELGLSEITGISRFSLNKVSPDETDADASPENGAKAKVVRLIRNANYLTNQQIASEDNPIDISEKWDFGYRIISTTYYGLSKKPIRALLAEQLLRWYAFIQQMSIFIGADSNLADEETFKELLPTFEQNQQLVDSWHDNTKAVPALKFSRDGSASFDVSEVMEPIRFVYDHPSGENETFYIYREPYKIYMHPRYTGRIAEMDAFVFLNHEQTKHGGSWIDVVRVPMFYSGTETDIFGQGTESEVWSISMALNNTLFFQNKISTGGSVSTDMSPLYLIRLAREKTRRYAFQAFVLVEWGEADVDICAFWSGWESNKYVGWSWGSSASQDGFSSTWNSSDNTQGGPEYVSVSYESADPPPDTSSFEVHLNWYRYAGGDMTAKVSCYDQFGNTRTATLLPSIHGGKAQPDDPGIRFYFDSAGNITGASVV